MLISDDFRLKMITKLERTHSNVQLNMEQTQTPTMGATINNQQRINNNGTAALERPTYSLLFYFICMEKNIVRTSV